MLTDETRQRIDQTVASDRVVLFMKGDRQQPQCGFSATVIGILSDLVPDYTTVDVLSDPEIRAGIKDYSSWPTIPQLYVGGEFVGGCDIIQELYSSGELHGTLGLEAPERVVPNITISEQAAAFLREHAEKGGGQAVHMRIDAGFSNRAYIGPAEPGEIVAEAGGIAIHFDLMSAQRAEGLSIDFVETPHGHDLRIENPNAPPSVKQIDVGELAELMKSAEPPLLVDVRTADEHAKASIPGARLLDAELHAEITALPKDTPIVFHCHHGGRSQQAADALVGQGFTRVTNVTGGIDAWSQQVDSSVPRY